MRALGALDASRRGPGGPARPYVLMDVFTDTPLQGNPLAVFTDGRGMAPQLMQQIAARAEPVRDGVRAPPERGGDVRVRIFTPQSRAALRRSPRPRRRRALRHGPRPRVADAGDGCG